MTLRLKERTPEAFMCSKCAKCPAVFETENDSYVIIGKILPPEVVQQLAGRIGDDEFVIEVPKGMIDKMG